MFLNNSRLNPNDYCYSCYSCYSWNYRESIVIFSPQNGLDMAIFPIFAPAKSGEIDLARESAFFALFLEGELGQFA